MTKADIDAIVGGYHGDAFRILGPHTVENSEGRPKWEVRAFLPRAASADVLTGADAIPMTKRRDEGLFVASLEGEPRPYTLRTHLRSGDKEEFEDPYRFPPQLSDLQLHLNAEGTNYESYTMLGAHLTESEGVR